MSRKQKTPNARTESKAYLGPRDIWLLIGVFSAVAIAMVAFLRTPLPAVALRTAEGEPLTRGDFLSTATLLFDELSINWFGQDGTFTLFDRAPVLGLSLAILAVFTATGWMILGGFAKRSELDRLEAFLFSLAVGANLWSLYTLLIGLGGLLRFRFLFIVPAAVITVLAMYRLWIGRTSVQSISVDRNETLISCPVINRCWLWLAAPVVLFTLLGSMLPPIDFDVREYHLQSPKEFYLAGQITFLPHNVYANMPLGAQMFSLLGMVLMDDWFFGALVGKTVIGMFPPLTALALFAAGRRFFHPVVAVVAPLVYLTIAWVARVSMLGLVEGVVAFYFFMALYAVLLWFKSLRQKNDSHSAESGTGSLLLSGFLAGAAVSCKYTAIPFLVIPLAALIPFAMRRSGVRRVFQTLALLLLMVGLGCGPWLVKNWMVTGNPTYPVLASVFGGETRTVERDAQWRAAHHPKNYELSDAGAQAANFALRSMWQSPLLIPLAMLSLLALRGQSQEFRRLVFGLLGYVVMVLALWWLLTHRLERFWVPVLPVVALLSGVGAGWNTSRIWRTALPCLLVFGMYSCFLFSFLCPAPPCYYRFFASYDETRTDSARVDPWYQLLNEESSNVGVVLCVGEAEVFDLEVPVLYNTVFDACQLESMLRDKTPQEFHAMLAQQNITQVLVNWGDLARYRSPGNYDFGFGQTDFAQPEVFDSLVKSQVLAPAEPPIEGISSQLFRVLPLKEKPQRD